MYQTAVNDKQFSAAIQGLWMS